MLRTVTYPYGATVTYDYDYVCFNSTGAARDLADNGFFARLGGSGVIGDIDPIAVPVLDTGGIPGEIEFSGIGAAAGLTVVHGVFCAIGGNDQ